MSYTNAIFRLDPINGSDSARTPLTSVSFANNGSGGVRCTKVAHGLVTGAVVDVSATTNYNGAWKITKIDNDNFDLDTASYVSSQSSGTVTPRGGMNWADAWKTITSGPTTARAQAGDVIRISKSPDPVSLGINATFTDNSATITLASTKTKTVCPCESNWIAATADLTCTLESNAAYRKQGSYCQKIVFGTNFTTGKAAHFPLGSILDFSAYTAITFWLYSAGAYAANMFRIDLCSDTAGDVVVDSFTIATGTRAAKFIPLTISRDGGGSLGNSIQSIRLHCLSDPGTATIYLDNFEACDGGFGLTSLIGKNDDVDQWWPIKSIVETAVTLEGNYLSKSSIASELVTCYYRNPLLLTPGTAIGAVQVNGTAPSPLTFTGGWNTSSDIRDGDTWISHQTLEGTGIASGKNYIKFERLYFTKTYQIFDATSTTKYNEFLNFGGCHAGNILLSPAVSDARTRMKNIYVNTPAANCDCIYLNGNRSWWDLENVYAHGANSSSRAGINLNQSVGLGLRGKNINCFGNYYGMNLGGWARIESPHTRLNTYSGVYLTAACWWDLANTNFEEATPIATATALEDPEMTGYSLMNYQGVAGDNRVVTLFGEIRRNTADAQSGACAKMTPNTASEYLPLILGPIPAASGVQKTVTAYLKKDVSYNGADPRISLRKNGFVVAGPTACTVSTSYQQFTINYTPTEDCVLELLVECDGTAGSIYVDDVGHSGITQPLSDWIFGSPVLAQVAGAGGGEGGLIL